MDVKIIQIEQDILIGGFLIKSSGETFNEDIQLSYNNFIQSGKIKSLNSISKNSREYYAVTWYDDDMEDEYALLLGQKINEKTDNLEIKIIRKGEYAVKRFPPKYDAAKAWTDLYAESIPGIGYKPIVKNNIAFVYYSNGLEGENEIWALVEKA
jgi:DNA gyrase inhibitor GyrI